MKIFNKLLILMVLAALAGPFFLKKPDGTPLLNWRDFIPQNPLKSVKESVVPSTPKKMYKWKDAKGHWQFGDMPPEGVIAQEMQVKTQINEMKTIELPEGFRDKPEQQQTDTSRFDPTQKSATPLSTAPLTEVPKMLDQIEQFQGKLDERQKSLDAL